MNDVLRASEDLWAKTFAREGTVVRWLVTPGTEVVRGTPIVEIKIMNALHKINASASGRLDIRADQDSSIKPGAILAFIAAQGWRRMAVRSHSRSQAMPLAS